MTECSLCSCVEFNSIKGGSFCGTCKHHVLKHSGNSRTHSSSPAGDSIVAPAASGDNRYLKILTHTVYSYRNKRHISSARSPIPYVQGTRLKYYDIACDFVNGELEYWYCVENDKSPNARWICSRDQSWLRNDHISVDPDETAALPPPPPRPSRNDRQDPTKNTELLRKVHVLNLELMEVLGTLEEMEDNAAETKPQSLFSNFLSGIFSCVSDSTAHRDNASQRPITFDHDGNEDDEFDHFNSMVPLDQSISSFDSLDNPYIPSAKQSSSNSFGNSSRGNDVNGRTSASSYSARQALVPPEVPRNPVVRSNSRLSDPDSQTPSPTAQAPTRHSVSSQPVRASSSVVGSPVESGAGVAAIGTAAALKASAVSSSSTGPISIPATNNAPCYEEAWNILTNPKAIKSGEDVKAKFDALIDDLGVEKAEDLKLITESSVSSITKCMKEVFGGKFADAWRAGR